MPEQLAGEVQRGSDTRRGEVELPWPLPRHRRQLRLIFDALAAGKQPPVPGREARKAVDVILGIYESARTGTRIDIIGSGSEA